MQTVYKRYSVIAGFALLFFLLVFNAIVTRRNLGVQVENQVGMAHSRQVLYELSETESLLKDAETGQRGFLLTGDSRYLTPYNESVEEVMPQIDALAKVTVDRPSQQARVRQIRNLAQEKLTEMAETIALYNGGRPDLAKDRVLSHAGLGYMDQLRLLIVQMEGEEEALDIQRTNRYQDSIDKTIRSIYLSSLFAVVGLAVLAFYILRDIRLREQHAADLRAREEWFRVTLTSIGDGVIATDAEGKVTFFNSVAEQLTGRRLGEVRGRFIHDVFPIFNEFTLERAANPVDKVRERGIVVGLANHTVLQHVDGRLTPIEDSAAPIRGDRQTLLGVVLVFRDVTHERKSEEVLRKTEKLASAARLSATVAHEINNPLAAIFNLVYLAKTDPDAPEQVIRQLSLAEQELERVAHITGQTLGFYRDSSVPEPIRLDALVESILMLYAHKLEAKNIRVVRQIEECPPLVGVPGELKQAISNLVSNAADAVGTEGTITLHMRPVDEGGGEAIELVVEDDGPGIPAEYTTRIFEPFFTTKQDVGTGLGLWVTKGIVDRHGGSLILGAPAGTGTRKGAAFTLRLPLKSGARGDAPAITAV